MCVRVHGLVQLLLVQLHAEGIILIILTTHMYYVYCNLVDFCKQNIFIQPFHTKIVCMKIFI